MIGGVGSSSHDGSIAFLDKSGNIKFASHCERYTRVKHDNHFSKEWWEMLRSCKYVSHFDDYNSDTSNFFKCGDFTINPKVRFSDNFLKCTDTSPQDFFTGYTEHHESHAASAFYTRPWDSFEDTVVLTLDGKDPQTYISNTIWKYDGNKLKKLEESKDSIGRLYTFFSVKILDMGALNEGSTMGLSSFGKFNHEIYQAIDSLHQFMCDNPLLKIDQYILKYISPFMGKKAALKLHKEMKKSNKWNSHFHYSFRKFFNPSLEWQQDCAHTLQVYAEEKILEWAKRARKHGSKLCYAGGIALNILANSKIKDLFDDVWIVPDAGDSGGALGTAAVEWNKVTGKNRLNFIDAYLGYDIKREVNPKEVVEYLLKHKVCGVANGRAEWGPRALGNRSLIGDVRYNIKDTVNGIKQRQPWRPFGPVILEEEFSNWFDGHTNNYMQYACKPKHEYHSVIHVDGTSRVQTVPSNSSSIIRPILEEYYERTGVPMLLNTSLNIKGSPMVNDEHDASEFEQKYQVKVF